MIHFRVRFIVGQTIVANGLFLFWIVKDTTVIPRGDTFTIGDYGCYNGFSSQEILEYIVGKFPVIYIDSQLNTCLDSNSGMSFLW